MKKNIIISILIVAVAIIAIIFVSVTNNKPSEVAPIKEEVATEMPKKIEGRQTYRNEELGFEVQYPEGWFVKEYKSEMVSFGPGWSRPGGGLWRVIIGMSENTPENEVEDFISNQNKSHTTNRSSIKNIEISGYPAISFESQTEGEEFYRPATRIFVSRNGKIFGIFEDEGATSEGGPGNDNGETFKKFYESFRFID
ncbi:hypothetical protein KKG48_01685 [Patescibacteria group bacterium]|nr:hypothetical protein [Patescibacteria group bacterium]